MNNSDMFNKYLRGEMSEQERFIFENKIKKDTELAEEVNLQREIEDTLKDTEILDFHEQLDSVYKKLKEDGELLSGQNEIKKNFRIFHIRWYFAAASVIFLIGISTVLYLMLRPALNNRLYAQYFQPYDGSYIVRSEGIQTNIKYSQATDLYNAANYEKSWNMFNDICAKDSSDISVFFFKGISAMEINNYNDAIVSFKFIIKDNSTLFAEHAKWYLALCYLKDDDTTNALKLFKDIASGNSYYKVNAKKILEKLSD